MAKRHKLKNQKCHLFPYEVENLITIQDVEQRVGWEITAFNLPEAWKYTQGDGVVVAVLDSGVDLNHEDLIENLLPGKNFVNIDQPPIDLCNHGTHITGIVCAANNALGVVGVAPKTKVIPVKVLDEKGSGTLPVVAQGIRWAADQKADFIVMSLGAPNPMPVVYEAILYAQHKGVVIFCAAGNAGNKRQVFYPAAYPEVIGVGAIDQNLDLANFSCTGPDLDFLAPGVKILSTVPNNWYAVFSGTSQANPFVAGVACLLLSYKRQKNLSVKLETGKDYIDALKQYTISVNNPKFAGQKFFEGFGIIDPRKLEDWIKLN